jgi:hypothetical protein
MYLQVSDEVVLQCAVLLHSSHYITSEEAVIKYCRNTLLADFALVYHKCISNWLITPQNMLNYPSSSIHLQITATALDTTPTDHKPKEQ